MVFNLGKVHVVGERLLGYGDGVAIDEEKGKKDELCVMYENGLDST